MSQSQTSAITLARNILDGIVDEVSDNDYTLLMQAASTKSNLGLDMLAHKVIRAFARKEGFFADHRHAA